MRRYVKVCDNAFTLLCPLARLVLRVQKFEMGKVKSCNRTLEI